MFEGQCAAAKVLSLAEEKLNLFKSFKIEAEKDFENC